MERPNHIGGPFISVISPIYGCKDTLREFCNRLEETLTKITEHFEIILVDDASPDIAWEVIIALASKDSRIKGIQLSRNFGQHYAITAGLEYAAGEWIVVIDCDLQDRPEEILNLYQTAKNGYDIVHGQRIQRKDNFIKKAFSFLFYRLLSFLTGLKQDSTIANFGIYHRKAIQAVCTMQDKLRYFPSMIQWVGFKKTSIPVEHDARTCGKSSYSFRQLARLSLDVILASSDKPLRLTVKLGILIALLAFVYAILNVFRYFSGEIEVMGWTSLIISIWFLAGVIIILIGIVGLYIGKIFDSVKGRPKFIVCQTLNITNKQDV